jgi:hypothetical protein
MENIKTTAIELLQLGYNIIPVENESKIPAKFLGSHNLFDRKATLEEAETWFDKYQTDSIGLVNGITSNNLVTLDFDELGLYEDWYSTLKQGFKVLISNTWVTETRSGGKHVRFRTEKPQATIKLASRKDKDNKTETLAETRGDRSYALIPPTNGYKTLHGDFTKIEPITDEVYQELLETFKPFNEIQK